MKKRIDDATQKLNESQEELKNNENGKIMRNSPFATFALFRCK